jgi:hypothetical protein
MCSKDVVRRVLPAPMPRALALDFFFGGRALATWVDQASRLFFGRLAWSTPKKKMDVGRTGRTCHDFALMFFFFMFLWTQGAQTERRWGLLQEHPDIRTACNKHTCTYATRNAHAYIIH